MKTLLKTTIVAAGFAAISITPAFAGNCSDKKNKTAMNDHSTMTSAQADIVGLAAGDDNFGTLVAAVKAADLVSTLQSDGPFTVFAPTNDAFAMLPDGTVPTLLKPENKSTLQGVLTYHVVAGEVKAADLVHAINDNGGVYNIQTVNGETLSAQLIDGAPYLIDANRNAAKITATDLDASNGVIHVINRVVLP